MKHVSIKPPKTITETIYQYLKKTIINGEFKPNQRLQEKEIAEIFSVSTTPVREAFQRLSAEKYVILDARKEVIVAELSSKQIKELYEFIRILDTYASKKALKNIADKDISEFKKMTDKLIEFYKKNKIHSYIKQSTQIHEILWKNCGNELIYRSLVDLMEKATAFGDIVTSDFLSIPLYFERSCKDHIELMTAVENRDAAEVGKIISSHWGKDYYG